MLLTIEPQVDQAVGDYFEDIKLEYFYVDHPEKSIDIPVLVSVQGCEDDGSLVFDVPSSVQEVVIGDTEVINVAAPGIKGSASCSDYVDATYSFVALSVPDGASLSDFIIYNAENHTFDFMAQDTVALLGTAVSGRLIGDVWKEIGH